MQSADLVQQKEARRPPSLDIVVLHHTHWDREWWSTFQDFRVRLVELIDDLLRVLESDPTFEHFSLDHQMVVLRDYLEIRPENAPMVARFMREGRISCGPWYVLPDEFLVSGEAHIRNLWLGRRLAERLQCPVEDIGYLPDMFGHISQMPQLLRGFGIDNAFIWRGRGGGTDAAKQEFVWEAPDGSRVLTHWFPNGYYQMPFLHLDDPDRPFQDKLGRVGRIVDELAERATTDVLLMPYGGDHQAIDRDLAVKIERANGHLGDRGRIRWGRPDDYLAAMRRRNPPLDTVRGELRDFGSAHPYMLPGVLSARLYLKQHNHRTQTWLERYAEPLSALAWAHGGTYDAALIWTAWELLVQNNAHDSICGCSIDQVHREMVSRIDQSLQIAQIVADKSARHINGLIDTQRLGEDETAIVIHNSLPRRRSGWASVWLGQSEISPATHRVLDGDGVETPFQVRDVQGLRPMSDRSRWTEVGFLAREVPGLGHRTYRLVRREEPLDPRQRFFKARQPVARLKGSVPLTDLSIGGSFLENQYLRVEVDPRSGALSITDKESGERYSGLNVFEDGGDAGDTYNYSAPLGDVVLRSDESAGVHVSIAEAGYARSSLQVDVSWSLPDGLTEDRLSRSSSYRRTGLSTLVTLMAESRRVDVETEWNNVTRDHRLRVLFPLGANVSHSSAEGQFEVSRRPTRWPDLGNGWEEPFVPTLPQQGWVSVSNGRRGLTIANRGLPEYEVLPDGQGTVALTLLRAVGWLSREDLLGRTGGAGPSTPTPDAQCLGAQRVTYSVIPHAGDWLAARSYLHAQDFLVPLYGTSTGRHGGRLEMDDGLISLLGDHTLVTSACKKAEDSEALILRFWNVASEPTSARVVVRRPLMGVRRVDLREEPIGGEPLRIESDGSFSLDAGPSEIVTVALSLAEGTR